MLQHPISFLLRHFLLESEICPLERGSHGVTRKQYIYVYEKPPWVCLGAAFKVRSLSYVRSLLGPCLSKFVPSLVPCWSWPCLADIFLAWSWLCHIATIFLGHQGSWMMMAAVIGHALLSLLGQQGCVPLLVRTMPHLIFCHPQLLVHLPLKGSPTALVPGMGWTTFLFGYQ